MSALFVTHALLYTATVAPLPTAATSPLACGFSHVDDKGYSWSWNLTDMTMANDYTVVTGGKRFVLNICRPPLAICRPQGHPPMPGTPTAIAFSGPLPAASSQCGLQPCTQQCTLLGWGALGVRSHWSLIDRFEPAEGVRLTHVGLLPTSPPPPSSSPSNATSSAAGSPDAADAPMPPLDEWGQPRPPLLTVDLVCEPKAPRPTMPLEIITIAGQQPSDTAMRLRTPYACPAHRPPPTAAMCAGGSGSGSDAAAAAGGVGAPASSSGTPAVPANVVARAGGGMSWLQFFGALFCAVVVVVMLFLGFAPLSLRSALAPHLAYVGAAEMDTSSWAPVHAAPAEDDRPARRQHGGGGAFDMEYRAL